MTYGGMRTGEGYNRGIAAVTALAAAVALAGCSGSAKPADCLSPRAVSQTYPGDPNAISTDLTTWHTGVEIDTPIPSGTQGMIVSFRDPNGDWDSKDTSKLISPERAGVVAVKIGHGAVVFSTQLKAAGGSSLCETKPDSTFSNPQPFDTLIAKGDLLPSWG